MSTIANRYEFVYLFDVKDGNPNGDPDAGNMPRIDAETGHGIVTDVSLKRKVRNYISIIKKEKPPFDIYIKEKAILIEAHEKAYQSLDIDLSKESGKRKGGDNVPLARKWMCQNFFDIRTFGAVMSLKVNAGTVKGPIQLSFGRSIDPILQLEHSITRMAVATKEEAEKQSGDNRTMGKKHTVPYGLYRAHGFVSAYFAEDTGFSEDDLQLFWAALRGMYDHDRAAARGEMTARRLIVFKHTGEGESAKLGTHPAHKLFESVTVERKDKVLPPRSYSDYNVEINQAAIDTLKGKIELLDLI